MRVAQGHTASVRGKHAIAKVHRRHELAIHQAVLGIPRAALGDLAHGARRRAPELACVDQTPVGRLDVHVPDPMAAVAHQDELDVLIRGIVVRGGVRVVDTAVVGDEAQDGRTGALDELDDIAHAADGDGARVPHDAEHGTGGLLGQNRQTLPPRQKRKPDRSPRLHVNSLFRTTSNTLVYRLVSIVNAFHPPKGSFSATGRKDGCRPRRMGEEAF